MPVLCAYFIKSNGASVFFTVCTGFVLVNLASADIGNLLHRANIGSISPDTTNLLLVFVPSLLSLLLARSGSSGQFHKTLSLAAAACAGGLMVLTTAPFFGSALPTSIVDSWLWTNLQSYQSWIIGAGALASFSLIWMNAKISTKHKK